MKDGDQGKDRAYWVPGDALSVLSGVGPSRTQAFADIGLKTIGELLFHLPRRYEKWEGVQNPAPPFIGRVVVVEGEVKWTNLHRFGRRRSVLKIRFLAGEADLELEVLYFNQPYQAARFQKGSRFRLKGKLEIEGDHYLLRAPKNEKVETGKEPRLRAEGSGIAPVYSGGEGLRSDFVSTCLTQVLTAGLPEKVVTNVTAQVVKQLDLPPLAEALRRLHRPRPGEDLEPYRRRLALEEAWRLLERARRERKARARLSAPVVRVDGKVEARIRARLPFRLHPGQERAWREIKADLARGCPMARLLQGDVGSGKTAVAVNSALACMAAGRQVAFMAPTQVLARQHGQTLRNWLTGARTRLALLTAGTSTGERREIQAGLAVGSVDLVVGTHALLGEGVQFKDLGLVVIDEQQRFGVEQRAALRERGQSPHTLVLSATPIPRTLALTVYGGLDVSRIDGLPPGRKPVATEVLVGGQMVDVLPSIRSAVAAGGQVFLVCPRIGKVDDVGSVKHSFAALTESLAAGQVALAHGDQKDELRENAFDAFRRGEARVLVATTVVEVGVDVPTATLMVVLDADSFGLSTLHQLRGRVGRGQEAGRCILCTRGSESASRLNFLEQEQDGFRVAEEDLRDRGPGDPAGERQHGLGSFHALRPLQDLDLLAAARQGLGYRGGLDLEP